MVSMGRGFGFVLSDEDGELLVKVCQLRRESLSGFTKRAVLRELARLGYVDSEDAEALLREVASHE